MSKFHLFCIAWLLLTASTALSQDIRYKFDDKADFSKFSTYKWVALKSEAPIDKLTDEQIKAALDAALARKNLTKVEGHSAADLLIGYPTTEHIDEKFAGLGPGWHGGPTGDGTNEAWIIHKRGTRGSHVRCGKHELVWRGAASKSLDPKATPEKRQKNLDKAVAKLMKNYPPPAQK